MTLRLAGVGAADAAIYLTAHIVGDLAGAFFWVVAGASFDMRAAKRALPRIAAAGTVGAALGGFAAPLSARLAGATGLLALAIVATASAAIAAALLLPRTRDSGAAAVPSSPVLRRPPLTEDRTLAWAIVVGAVAVSAVTIAGRLLYARALDEAYAGDAARIVAQNGILAGVASVATAVVQVTLAPRMLARFGVRTTMIVFPLAMVAVFAGLAARFALLTGVIAHFATTILRKGLQAPSEGVLPAALPREQAGRVLLWASALGAPLGMALAGGGLRALRHLPAAAQALAGLVLASALVAVTLWRSKSYLGALRLRLRKGGSELRLRLGGELGAVGDVRTLLATGLEADDPALPAKLETLLRVQREGEASGPDGRPRPSPRAVAEPRHLEAIVERRLGEALRLRAATRRLADVEISEGLRALWHRAIGERIEQDAVVVIHALRLNHRRRGPGPARPRLFDRDPRARGAAMEVLEASCPPAWRAPLLALVEDRGADLGRPDLRAARGALGRPGGGPAGGPRRLDAGGDHLRAGGGRRSPARCAHRGASRRRRSLAGACLRASRGARGLTRAAQGVAGTLVVSASAPVHSASSSWHPEARVKPLGGRQVKVPFVASHCSRARLEAGHLPRSILQRSSRSQRAPQASMRLQTASHSGEAVTLCTLGVEGVPPLPAPHSQRHPAMPVPRTKAAASAARRSTFMRA